MNRFTTITSYWHTLNRTTTLLEGKGKVELEIYPNETFGYIYDLWVNPNHRGKGIATLLLEEAEKEAKAFGMKTVKLYWDAHDTPLAILAWYKRNGYEEIAYKREEQQVLLEKEL